MAKQYAFILSIALAVLFLSFASALTITNVSAPVNVTHNAGSFQVSFNLTNEDTANSKTVNFASSVTSGTATILSLPSIVLASNESRIISTTVNFPAYQSLNIAGTITASNGTLNTDTKTFSVPITNIPSFTSVITRQITKTQNGTINITNTGNTALTLSLVPLVKDYNISVSQSSLSLSAGNSALVNVSSTSDLSNLKLRDNVAQLNVSTVGLSDIVSFTVPGSFCKYGVVGSDLEIRSILDKSTNTANEWEWQPLDDLTIEVKLRNNGDKDRDVTVKLELVTQNGTVVEFAEDTDLLEQEVSIDSDSTETVDFDIQVASDTDVGEDLRLYVKVYDNEKEQCQSDIAEVEDIQDVQLTKDTHNVVVRNVDAPDTANCGSNVELTAKAYNIGETDEDKVKVIFEIKELGIELEKEFNDLSTDDFTSVTFNFDIPSNATSKIYKYILSTEFYYSDSSDAYRKVSKSEDDFESTLNVLGNCQGTGNQATITATLSSDATVGEEMKVTVTLANSGSTADFILTANGYGSWASLVSIEPQLANIPASSSRQFIVTLKPTAKGAQSFNLQAVYNGKTITQPVQVNIKEGTSFLDSFSDLGNTALYIIAAIALILIIIIIVLIVKVASRKSSY